MVGGDTLTCGECKRDFKLQELTLFIQHKALAGCRAEKTEVTRDCPRSPEQSRPPGSPQYASLGSPSVSGSGQPDCSDGCNPDSGSAAVKPEPELKKLLVADAETNTVTSSGRL